MNSSFVSTSSATNPVPTMAFVSTSPLGNFASISSATVPNPITATVSTIGSTTTYTPTQMSPSNTFGKF